MPMLINPRMAPRMPPTEKKTEVVEVIEGPPRKATPPPEERFETTSRPISNELRHSMSEWCVDCDHSACFDCGVFTPSNFEAKP